MWVNSFKNSYTYDLSDNMAEFVAYSWSGSSWLNWYKYSYIYDSHNNMTEELFQYWDGFSWMITNKRLFTYTLATDIKDDMSMINSFNLSNNYPNPFNPSTKIKYAIPASLNPSEGGTFVTLKVFDLLGREVATLVNEDKPTGNFEIEFNASSLPSGVYFYQLKANGFVETKKMAL
jgi:hypothetical protein